MACAGDLHGVVGAGQAGRELGEHGRYVGDGQAGLLGVAAVVDADGEHLGRSGHRVAQLGGDERPGPGSDAAGELDEGVPVPVEGHGVGSEASV